MAKKYDFWLSPLYIGLIAVIAWAGSGRGGSWGVLFLVFLFGLIVCLRKDCTPVVPLVFMAVQASGSPTVDGTVLTASCLYLAVCFCVRTVRFPPGKNRQKVTLFSFSCSAFTVVIGLGGLLFPKEEHRNAIILCCMGCFLFVRLCRTSFLRSDKAVDFLCQTVIVSSLLACVQLLSVMAQAENLFAIIGNKESLSVGFGSSNQVSNLIARALPVYFYYSVRKRKFAPLWLLPLFATVLFLPIPLARATLAGASIVFVLCTFFCLKRSPKKPVWITLFVFLSLGTVFLIGKNSFFSTLFALLKERGIEDSGRLSIWQSGWELFLQNPIFGTGLGYRWGEMNAGEPYWYHNTVIQTAACLGTTGLCSLLFFIVAQYRHMKKCENAGADFLVATLFLIQMISLLDVHFYTPQDFLEMILFGFCCAPEQTTGIRYISLEMPRR